ncbi:MAG: CocE/NonD family hydrolase [Pseudomonadota bacterium]
MIETAKTLAAAWPILKNAIRSGQVLRPQCTLQDPDPDVLCQYDIAVPIGDDVVLTANVFRSHSRAAAGTADPVVMCAHPYDNHLTPALGKTPFGGPPQQYRLIPQAGDTPAFSTLTSWEAPDPNVWVQAGYTLVNLNLPGYANSGGQAGFVSPRQGDDYYAALKWVAAQPWCDGNIGLLGVSYLAISQYHAAVAAADDGDASPLKCMAPWEGMSDPYRDVICRGGVEDHGFLNFWWHTEVKESLNNPVEDFAAREGALPPDILSIHPLFDAYWQDKAVNFAKLRTPMLVCASFSDHELHTCGSFRAYEEAASAKKWVYTHRGGKWASFYSDEVKALLKDFMDHHLKGVSNRFDTLPPVRLEVRSGKDTVQGVRWASDWPLPETRYQKLFLAPDGLSRSAPDVAQRVSYSGTGGSAMFDFTFTEETELSGYMKLRLSVETAPDQPNTAAPDDMVICAFVDKRDRTGRSVRFNGAVGQVHDMVTRGYIRVSRRALDPLRSTDFLPVPTGASEQMLTKNEVVAVDISLCPSSTFFAAGEGIRLIVSSTEIVRAPIFRKDTSQNTGTHILHFGGVYDAHLLIPDIAVK